MSFSSNLNHYGMVHMSSVSDVLLDNSFTPPCQRMGAMVAFRSFQEFTKSVQVNPNPGRPLGRPNITACVCASDFWFHRLLKALNSLFHL